MATSVVMPALEMAQETGKIVSWVKKEGDTIKKGEILLEVETDKAVVEIEANADGVLAAVKSQAGDVVPVGTTIAWILKPGESVPVESAPAAPAARTMTEQPRPAAPAAAASAPAASAPISSEDSVQISPKARRLAKEKGVDITRVRGTGPDGVITTDDIAAAAQQAAAPAPAAAADPASASYLPAIARLMAERTTHSWNHIPHFFLVRDLDAGALNEIREKLGPAIQSSKNVKLTHTDILVALVARVLTKHPKMNASFTGKNIQMNASVNISVAMAVKDGVVGPVIPKADTTSLGDIAAQRKELTDRARDGKLRPTDLTGGTFTITNLGMYNIDSFS